MVAASITNCIASLKYVSGVVEEKITEAFFSSANVVFTINSLHLQWKLTGETDQADQSQFLSFAQTYEPGYTKNHTKKD